MITRRGFVAGAAASSLPLIGHASPLASPRAREVFSGSTIFIGQSAVRSGPSQMLGDEMAFGMQAAFAAVNRAGGVNGRQLALKERDDGYEPNRCKDNTRALIEENVFALAGFVGTPTCAAVLPMVHEAGIPFVGCFTGAEALRQPRAGVFHIRASYSMEARAIVSQFLAFGGGTKVAIVRQKDGYGDAVEAAVRAALDEVSLRPEVVAYVERNSTDVSAAVDVIRKSGATCVALGSVYAPIGQLMRELGPRSKAMMWASVSFVGTSGLQRAIRALREQRPNDDLGGGVGVCQVMPSPSQDPSKFVAGYQRAMRDLAQARGTPIELSYGSLEGYASAMTVVEGIRRCGDNLSRQRFVDALEAPIDLGGFVIPFSPSNHSPVKFTELTVVDSQGRLRR